MSKACNDYAPVKEPDRGDIDPAQPVVATHDRDDHEAGIRSTIHFHLRLTQHRDAKIQMTVVFSEHDLAFIAGEHPKNTDVPSAGGDRQRPRLPPVTNAH